MTATTSQRMRSWSGPALLTYGFRPFFLGAAVWAVLSMALWLAVLTTGRDLPTRFDPASWHAHEFLFGYLGAVVAGFLLTAVPNWTGRLPIVGWRLGALAGLWLAGRVVVLVSAHVPAAVVAAVDLAFPVVLAAAITREIVSGRNWRNLVVLGMLTVFLLGNALFHWQAATGEFAAGGAGLRLGLASAVMMIAVIGGRIVPSFTRNWLVKRKSPVLPAAPMQAFDKLSLACLLAALALWVGLPDAAATGIALVVAGGLHLGRLARWAGHRTWPEPLVTVLHAGYLFVPLGAIGLGREILWPGLTGMAAAQHLWMAGAIGLMTLAVMTRATLGHTGQALTAGRGTVAIYLSLCVAAIARLGAGAWPELAQPMLALAALGWMAAFGGFVAAYGPDLLRLPAGKKI